MSDAPKSAPLGMYPIAPPNATPNNEQDSSTLPPSNQVLLRNGPDPANSDIDTDDDRADDVKHLAVVLSVVTEDDGENNTTEVTHGARETRNDAISMRMHMRHEPEIGTISALEKHRHGAHKAKHGTLVLAVQHADDDQENTRDDAIGVQDNFLRPHAVAGSAVREIGDESAKGPCDAVEQAEHGGPVAGRLEGELGEVGLVVGAQDAVDAEFGAKGAEVAGGGDEGLECEDCGEYAFERGLLDDFGGGGVVCSILVRDERCYG